MATSASGVAAVEFGMVSPLFILVFLSGLDLTMSYRAKIEVKSAASAVSYLVYSKGNAITTSTEAANLIQDAKNLFNSLVRVDRFSYTIDVRFNDSPNGSTAGGFYCVSGYPAVFTPSSAGASCGPDLTAGKYVTLSVTGRYTPLFDADRVFGSYLTVNDVTHVRVQ